MSGVAVKGKIKVPAEIGMAESSMHGVIAVRGGWHVEADNALLFGLEIIRSLTAGTGLDLSKNK